MLHDEDVQTVNVDGKDVIAIHVPRAEYNLRPIYINNNPMRGTYCRNHEGDYYCSEQRYKMMVRDSFEDGNEKHWMKPELIEQPDLMQVTLVLHIENVTKDVTKFADSRIFSFTSTSKYLESIYNKP